MDDILQKTPGEALGPEKLALAGALSGFMTVVIMAPGERIKCLLQVQHLINLIANIQCEFNWHKTFEQHKISHMTLQCQYFFIHR